MFEDFMDLIIGYSEEIINVGLLMCFLFQENLCVKFG